MSFLGTRFAFGLFTAVFDFFVERFYRGWQRRILMVTVHLCFEFYNEIPGFLKLFRNLVIGSFKNTDLFLKIFDFHEIFDLVIRTCQSVTPKLMVSFLFLCQGLIFTAELTDDFFMLLFFSIRISSFFKALIFAAKCHQFFSLNFMSFL